MKNTIKDLILLYAALSIISCENHIDKYKVNLDSLQTLPDGFYAYRHGSVYVRDEKDANDRRIWYRLSESGNIANIVRVDDVKRFDKATDIDKTIVINEYQIDTITTKAIAQKFIDLSRKFKFGYISIDRENKIFFSYRDGLPEQYVMPMNDSVKNAYLRNKNFRLLKNSWFENTEE